MLTFARLDRLDLPEYLVRSKQPSTKTLVLVAKITWLVLPNRVAVRLELGGALIKIKVRRSTNVFNTQDKKIKQILYNS